VSQGEFVVKYPNWHAQLMDGRRRIERKRKLRRDFDIVLEKFWNYFCDAKAISQ